MARQGTHVRQQAVTEGLMSVQIKIDNWINGELARFMAEVRSDLRSVTGDAEQIERHIYGTGRIPVHVRADDNR